MAGKYRRLLERIAAEPSLVWQGRLSLRPWEKGLVLARSLAGAGA
jgi:phytoene synthase